MNDIMVSTRIPESLLIEIKKQLEKEGYMDISEGIRSIVRDKWLQSEHTELTELKKLREDIKEEVKKKTEKTVAKGVISELMKIKELIKEEGLSK